MNNQDYKYLVQWKWFAIQGDGKTFYAARMSRIGERSPRGTILMHQVIFGGPCDHKNRNGLDNRHKNLRRATASQQTMNQGLRKDNTSGFKGVSWYAGKWISGIRLNGKRIYLGYFSSKIKAGKAYDKAALKYFGEFAVLNFPKEAA